MTKMNGSDFLIVSASATSMCKWYFVEKLNHKFDQMDRIIEFKSVIEYGLNIGNTLTVDY